MRKGQWVRGLDKEKCNQTRDKEIFNLLLQGYGLSTLVTCGKRQFNGKRRRTLPSNDGWSCLPKSKAPLTTSFKFIGTWGKSLLRVWNTLRTTNFTMLEDNQHNMPIVQTIKEPTWYLHCVFARGVDNVHIIIGEISQIMFWSYYIGCWVWWYWGT